MNQRQQAEVRRGRHFLNLTQILVYRKDVRARVAKAFIIMAGLVEIFLVAPLCVLAELIAGPAIPRKAVYETRRLALTRRCEVAVSQNAGMIDA